MITATALCVVLLSSTIHAEDKNLSAAKKDTQKSLSTADFLGDNNVKIEAAIGLVDSYAMMGESDEGQTERREIESQRDLATNEIQEESKRFEKAKSDYVSKSTTMSDAAREKAEKNLMKMERDIKNLVTEKEEELKMAMQIATEKLAHELEVNVARVAKNENLDVVFDKMTGRAIYVSDKFDFTTKAIEEANKNYKVKLAQNKQAESALKVADNKAAAAKPAKVGA